jgi:hypothetical protein
MYTRRKRIRKLLPGKPISACARLLHYILMDIKLRSVCDPGRIRRPNRFVSTHSSSCAQQCQCWHDLGLTVSVRWHSVVHAYKRVINVTNSRCQPKLTRILTVSGHVIQYEKRCKRRQLPSLYCKRPWPLAVSAPGPPSIASLGAFTAFAITPPHPS